MGLDLDDLTEAVRCGDADDVVDIVKDELEHRTDPHKVLNAMICGIQALGDLFKDGQVFLPEVLVSVRAMNRGVGLLEPHLAGANIETKGTVVLGSVAGDIHDIGKNLVGMMLTGNGYKIVDIGINAPVGKFIAAVEQNQPEIVALSGLLTTTLPQFEIVANELEKAGLRGGLKVMVGGAPVSPEYAQTVGADGFAKDCVTAVDEANRLLQSLAVAP